MRDEMAKSQSFGTLPSDERKRRDILPWQDALSMALSRVHIVGTNVIEPLGQGGPGCIPHTSHATAEAKAVRVWLTA
jgi:hypothetical protein